MVASPKQDDYQNVLDLCFAIDYKTCRNSLIYDLISEFIEFYDTSYLDLDRNVIFEPLLDWRKSVSFNVETFFLGSDSFFSLLSQADEGLHNIYSALARLSNQQNHSPRLGANVYIVNMGDIMCVSFQKSNIHILRRLLHTDVICETFPDSTGRKISIAELHLDPENLVIKLDDIASSPLNQPVVFSEITYKLSHSDFGGQYLEINKCRILKREIEQDLQREASSDFLVEGL